MPPTAPPTLKCPDGPSDTGAYRLSWSGPESAMFRLVEDGTTLYEGPDLASTVTGRRQGERKYTVGVVDAQGQVAAWSSPCVVATAPPSLGAAFGLLGLGFVVFVATVVAVVRGHRAHRRGEIG